MWARNMYHSDPAYREKVLSAGRLRRKQKPELVRNQERANKLRFKYKITAEKYDEMLKAQGGVCALCKKPPNKIRLAVDHDHACCPQQKKSCGKCVRGLLCFTCNRWMGYVEKNLGMAFNLSIYLLSYRRDQ